MEGLAYLTLDADVKDDFVQDIPALQAMFELAKASVALTSGLQERSTRFKLIGSSASLRNGTPVSSSRLWPYCRCKPDWLLPPVCPSFYLTIKWVLVLIPCLVLFHHQREEGKEGVSTRGQTRGVSSPYPSPAPYPMAKYVGFGRLREAQSKQRTLRAPPPCSPGVLWLVQEKCLPTLREQS